MLFLNPKMLQDKEYICIDFFDTLMFRRIHSHQMPLYWAYALAQKFDLEYEIVISARKEVISESKKDECAIEYRYLCNKILRKLNLSISQEDFYEVSKEIETYLEVGVQYINHEIYKFIEQQQRIGKKIILITDFYLPAECYLTFGRRYGLEKIIDKVYCSSDLGFTKSGDGKLYEYILQDLNISPERVFMIGDSLVSDKENAEKYQINAYRYFPFLHKIKTNLCKRLNWDCKKQAFKNICTIAKKDILLGEYAVPLSFFTKELYEELKNKKMCACFLSRGGFFLKKEFDAYQKLSIPKHKVVHTEYLFNSRKVNKKAESNDDAKKLLQRYLEPYCKENKLLFIDEGWYGHGQLIFTKTLGLETQGYYLGLMMNYHEPECKRKGVLFGINEDETKSPYYGVFRTNCTLYEQILTAPHGSVEEYKCTSDGEIRVILKDNYKEKFLYENITANLQEELLDFSKALWVWQCELSRYKIAKYIIGCLLFASKEKRELLRKYDENYFDNAIDSSNKEFGHIKQVEISFINLLFNPEDYMRYFCKLREKCNSEVMYYLYLPIGIGIYGYCRLSIWFKHLKNRGNNEEVT